MAWFSRLGNIFRPEKLRGEIDEELRYHIEARTADNLATGMSPQGARADALRRPLVSTSYPAGHRRGMDELRVRLRPNLPYTRCRSGAVAKPPAA